MYASRDVNQFCGNAKRFDTTRAASRSISFVIVIYLHRRGQSDRMGEVTQFLFCFFTAGQLLTAHKRVGIYFPALRLHTHTEREGKRGEGRRYLFYVYLYARASLRTINCYSIEGVLQNETS